jgi:hypothetical protein
MQWAETRVTLTCETGFPNTVVTATYKATSQLHPKTLFEIYICKRCLTPQLEMYFHHYFLKQKQ